MPVFILIQVLVLNEILFFTYINPYLYLALIISYPLKASKTNLLLYSFILGFFIDLFGGSLGFHSTATIFIAFIKPAIAKILIPHNLLDESDEITLNKIGKKSFITFTFLMIFMHNIILFILEHLNINLQIAAKIFVSSLVTLCVILIFEIIE